MEMLFKQVYCWLNGRLDTRLAATLPLWITPNIITLARVLLALPIVALCLCEEKFLAVIIFIVAAVLDYADGACARGRNQVSEFGKFFDPISDKIFFVAITVPVSLIILFQNPVAISSVALLALVLCASAIEATLAAIRIDDFTHNQASAYNKRELKANWAGKLKFDLQIFAAGFMLIAYPKANHPTVWIAIALLAIALPLALLSLTHKQNQH